MKIIFLDIDGVLNYSDVWDRPENKEKGTKVWDSDCVNELNRIIKETDANIVLSSTWRLYSDHEIIVYNDMGIEGKFVGKTPDLFNKPRGIEIQTWLDENKHMNIENFVILDDYNDMEHLTNKLVLTDFLDKGLTKEKANEAIKMLNNG